MTTIKLQGFEPINPAVQELIDSLPVIKYEDLILTGKNGADGDVGKWVERGVQVRASFDADDELLIIDGCDSRYADYYGEFRGDYPWVHPELEKWAQERDLIIDWYDPGTLCVGVSEVLHGVEPINPGMQELIDRVLS